MKRFTDPECLKYRWIVLVASFMVRFLVFGTLFSVGVVYVAWLDEFQANKGDTAWIGSLATGSCLFVGPIASAMIERIGCRKTIVLGGAVMSAGLILSVFAPNIYYLYFTYGILAGSGGGVANLASVVRISEYFNRQRALAMGVGSSGVGLGAFAFAVFQQYLMDEYGWRGSLLVIGAFCLNIIVVGLLMIHPNQNPSFISTAIKTVELKAKHQTATGETAKRPSEQRLLTNEITFELDAQEDPRKEVHDFKDYEIDLTILKPEDHRDTSNSLMTTTPSEKTLTSRNRRKSSVFQRIWYKMRFTDQTKSLWRDPVFILLFTSDFMSWLIQFVPYVHLPQRAKSLGISSTNAAILVSSMGFSGAVGKLFFGAICTFFKLKPYKVFTVAQILFGISTILSPLCHTFPFLLIYALSFGFLSGAYTLLMVIPVDLFGFEKFSAAYGFLIMGEGTGVYLGPPIAGWISDLSDSYDTSFLCAGSVLLLSGMILLLRPLAEKLRTKSSHIGSFLTC